MMDSASTHPAARVPVDADGMSADLSRVVHGLVNTISVDVEDYFQVSAMEPVVARADWDRYESRVLRNVEAVLELFSRHEVAATFFVLGWVAERHPALIRQIAEAGHEVASHGMAHHRVSSQTPESFREDVRRAKALIEDAAGVRVRGYRAASFSIDATTDWAHGVLYEEGHAYSSSVYPIRHDHYGMPTAPRGPYAPIKGSDFLEIPISTLEFGKRRVPCGGGGYFRLLPCGLSERAIRRLNSVDAMPAVFYFHPWEIDPGQPRIPGLSRRTRFRHYLNLSRMESRLDRILARFSWSRMDQVFLDKGSG